MLEISLLHKFFVPGVENCGIPEYWFVMDKEVEPMPEANFYEVYCEVQQSNIHQVLLSSL